MSAPRSFDPVWEEKYAGGHGERAPWDEVVSFLFRNIPLGRPRPSVKILEVGSGTGNNLFFAAQEGFDVSGIDASPSAAEKAQARFREAGLKADLRLGDFISLPFADGSFDLAIDRAALTCCGTLGMQRAIGEIFRTLKPGGKFLFTPYADTHTSCRYSDPGPDGVRINIRAGALMGAGQIRFLSRDEVLAHFPSPFWSVQSLDLVEVRDMTIPDGAISAHWRAVAVKRP